MYSNLYNLVCANITRNLFSNIFISLVVFLLPILQLLPVSSLSPRQRLTYFIPIDLLLQTFHKTGVLCGLLCLSLSLVFLTFIHVVAVSVVRSFFLKNDIPVYNMPCFVCPSQWAVFYHLFLSFPLYGLPPRTI